MSKITAFIDSNIPLLAETLGSCVDICRFTGRGLSAKELIEGNCKYLFVRSTTKVNRELLDNTPVRFVGTATSGIDHIDSSFLESNRIAFADAPGSNANSVAEYVVFSILKWSLYKGIDLKGKSIGIIGYGNVGKIVGSYADNMKLKVFVNDPPLHDAGFEFPDYCKYSELSEISSCNIITNHVPLTNGGLYPTINLLDEKFITDMPNDSLFIHASRGGVADEDALLERMLKKEISGAIDVWYNEPLINSELAGLSIIATPHVAGYSRDGKLRGTLRMAQAFERHSGIKPDYSKLNEELSQYLPLPADEFGNYYKLFMLLEESRRIDEDTSKLLSSLKLPEPERGIAFDNLRKNYPVRREIL